MKIYIQTLGCKVNQYETQAMETMLRGRGHEICSFDDDYDAFIVNTCAVTAESGRKSRQAIRRAKQKRPDAVCAVCGCFSQISPEEIQALGADLVAGSGDRKKFVDELCSLFGERSRIVDIDAPLKRREYEELPAGSVAGRTRAMLKIQDGCNNFCSYCVIPYARGIVRSLPMDSAAAEAGRIAAEGYKELVITGIEIASYGIDLPGKPNLCDVIEKMAAAAPGVRLHLGSLEPRVVTEGFCKRLSKIDVCPHFHLSLQSGCDETLKRMRRKYTTDEFFRVTELLREYFPDCGITTDLITGFPGETEEEFQKTLKFIEKCRFSQMHIFPYSQRPGTPAADMPNQIEKSVKHQRAVAASKVAAAMEQDFLHSFVGKTLDVIFERDNDGKMRGHAGNYCEVQVEGGGARGHREKIEILSVEGCILLGKSVLLN
jgi:threonylcarbamoyladenosine tRNA methylthiotransferase MtaB